MFSHFTYQDRDLRCEEVELRKISEEVGTPFYVYSEAALTENYRAYESALAGIDHLICYAAKANSNLSILRHLFSLGAGADIVSGGELYRVLMAGCPADRVVFSGVGKTVREINEALDSQIHCFNVESESELETINRVAEGRGLVAPVSLRVNPNVDAQTHPYISTGLKNNKFGIASEDAVEIYQRALKMPGVNPTGIDCHIGSQLTNLEPLSEAFAILVDLVHQLKGVGCHLDHVDIGGGLGINYGDGQQVPTPADYGAAVRPSLQKLNQEGLQVIVEPGRSIVGTAGALVSTVLYLKDNNEKHFTVIDAAMNDLMRPALYNAHHPVMPVERREGEPRVTDVVGPICESGDFIARGRDLPDLHEGDLVCIGAAGAYAFSMSSNYNSRPRVAEVLVSGSSYRIIRQRETYRDLVALEPGT